MRSIPGKARGAGSAALILALAGALLCGPAWCLGHVLTQGELGRLLKVVDQRGSRTPIPASVASVLQLQPSQHKPDIKEAAYMDDDGIRHGFAPFNDGSGFFMVRSGAALGQVVYAVDRQMRLLRAAGSLLKNAPLVELPATEAQRSLDEEFDHWSKVLSPNGPSAASPFNKAGATAPGSPEPAIPYPFKKPDQKSP